MYEIDGFRYLPRQDGSNGRIGLYEFFVSTDGIDWGSPVVTGFFPLTAMEQEVTFPQVSGQYIKLVALTALNGEDFTTIAELNVLGLPFSGNFAPNGVIDSPVNNPTINVGGEINFLGTGTDAESPAGDLTYHWNFDDSGVDDIYVEDPSYIIFNTPGNYTVTFTVTDGDGRSDSTPAVQVINVLNGGSELIVPQGIWSLVSVNSEETVGEGPDSGRGIHAFDGDPNTLWHTQWLGEKPLPPHQITIDLGSAYKVTGLLYLPRQDWYNTRIGDFRVYLSADGRNWGNSNAMGTFSDDYSEKTVRFMPEMAQFLKLVALNSIDGNPPISAAEINLEGECNDPYVSIIDPQTNDVQQQSEAGLEVRASVCLKNGDHSGWGVKFVVDGISQQTVTLPPDGIIQKDTFTVTFSGLTLGNHMIEGYIVDNTGAEVAGETTYDVVTLVGLGDYYVAVGDSITAGFKDDILFDNTSQDGRNYGGGYPPILNDLLTAATGYAHTVVNEAQNGERTAGGLARLSTVLERHPYAGYFLIQYGTNDDLSTLPSGLGQSPGQSGYAGSYKDLVQQMIDLITVSGKTALLPKIPYTLYPALNVSMQAYNFVIDELVSENGIQVMPPDFYSYFEQHPEEMIDALHPSGVGYQSMADLWFDAIMN
jgi:lysophospholipase L1-like esterase